MAEVEEELEGKRRKEEKMRRKGEEQGQAISYDPNKVYGWLFCRLGGLRKRLVSIGLRKGPRICPGRRMICVKS